MCGEPFQNRSMGLKAMERTQFVTNRPTDGRTHIGDTLIEMMFR